MKIVHITFEVYNSSASLRIHKAIQNKGLTSQILVMNKTDVRDDIVKVSRPNYVIRALNIIRNIYEKKDMSKYSIPDPGMVYSPEYCGIDISKEKSILEADVIHLHWICGGYLRPEDIAKLLKLKKTIVWTMHDCWPMTGGCHHGCDNYQYECGHCPVLGSDIKKDVSYRLLKKKLALLSDKGIVTVSPSTWLQKRANASAVFKNGRNECIPNPLDTEVYRMKNADENFSDKFRVLFGAVDPTSPYKGFKYFEKSLEILKMKYPQIADKMQLIIYGTDHLDSKIIASYDHIFMGYINGDEAMSTLFRSGDVTVVPSAYDNLPDTVMESMSSGTPVLAFETGGIPDMVEHKKNGYLAKRLDPDDLCDGLFWIYNNNIGNKLGINAHEKIEKSFSMDIIGEKYIELYKSLIK